MDLAGKDGTEEFEDVGHSNEARNALLAFEIGELPPAERADATRESSGSKGGGGAMMLMPVLMVAVAAGFYQYSWVA